MDAANFNLKHEACSVTSKASRFSLASTWRIPEQTQRAWQPCEHEAARPPRLFSPSGFEEATGLRGQQAYGRGHVAELLTRLTWMDAQLSRQTDGPLQSSRHIAVHQLLDRLLS